MYIESLLEIALFTYKGQDYPLVPPDCQPWEIGASKKINSVHGLKIHDSAAWRQPSMSESVQSLNGSSPGTPVNAVLRMENLGVRP